ncbi:6-phosphogluconolactonase (cycloisomerase 2 family), partial [Rhodovulum imhoffii]
MSFTINDSTYIAGGTNSGWASTGITIDGQPFVVSLGFSYDGQAVIYRVNDDGTLTETDRMTYSSSTGQVVTTSGGNITSTITADPDLNVTALSSLTQSNIYEVDGTPTIFLTSQNGTGITVWSLDSDGHMTFEDGRSFGGSQQYLDGGIVREGVFYEGSDGTNYYYAARPQSDQITKFTYDNGNFVEVGTAASGTALNNPNSLDAVTIDGTGYLVASGLDSLVLYQINEANGNLTLLDDETLSAQSSSGAQSATEIIIGEDGTAYALWSDINEGSTYLYEIDATTGQLILSDTIVGYDSYFM